ncbi:MAG: long-chain fatty acid--CoA ligase [Deltaproteobacteria bacterium]|nr:long-chain fatty acid--CoA ligase [Deltaproteobacteria bacterium]
MTAPLLDALDEAHGGGLQDPHTDFPSWPALADRARALARTWSSHFAGRRVALDLPHGADLAAALWGALGAGATVIPFAPGIPPAARTARLARLRVDHVVTTLPAPATAGKWPDVPPGCVALLTSGSTGEPLAAHLSQDALLANAQDIVVSLSLRPDDVTLCVPSFHHAYGLSVMTSHLLVGARVVVEPSSAFPASLLQTATAAGCTGMSAVPTTYQLLMRGDLLARARPPRLRYANVAGGAVPGPVLPRLREVLGPAGLFVMYGQTEACARLTCLPPADGAAAPGSCGYPLRRVELRISPDGEVLARGPNLMDGYLDEAARTAEVLVDGWLHTGDLGGLDEAGRLHLLGRRKHVLKVGGTRIPPKVVEDAVHACAGVEACAVVGAPDRLLGEVPVAFVVGAVDEAVILATAAASLGPMERPRRVVRLDALPRLPGGKPDLVRLRAMAAGQDGGLSTPT